MENVSLTTIAEVGAAFAGFATLTTVLGRDPSDRHLAFGVVETSLIAVAFAMLPRMIVNLQASALLFLVVWTSAWAHAIRLDSKLRAGSGAPIDVPLPLRVSSMTITVAGSVFALLVVIPVWPDHDEWLYQSAVLCPLLTSGFLLWVTVRRLAFGRDGSAAELAVAAAPLQHQPSECPRVYNGSNQSFRLAPKPGDS